MHLFESYVGRTKGLKVLLMIDYASFHGSFETISDLGNVEVLFLPSNTTSCIHPLDAGVLHSIKSKCRKRQIDIALDLEEGQDGSNLYKIDLKTALIWMRDICSWMNSSTIYNFWRTTNLLDTYNTNSL